MLKTDLPAAVVNFVLRRIASVTELETLLIMSAEETRAWNADEIADLIYAAASSAAAVLHALERQRLIKTTEDGTRYCFSPAGDEERQLVLQTAIAYRTHLIPITTLIHKKSSGAVQEFARAFDLKKDE